MITSKRLPSCSTYYRLREIVKGKRGYPIILKISSSLYIVLIMYKDVGRELTG